MRDNRSTYIGVYLIDGDIYGTTLFTIKQPNWFRKFFIRIFLGWKWVTIKKFKELKND